MKKVAIALISNDLVGSKMAGPGIRYFELAKALSANFDITLLVPDSCDVKANFRVETFNSRKASSSIAGKLGKVDFVISQSLRPPLLRTLRKRGIKYIADLYDPLTIETLEYTKYDKKRVQENTFLFNYHSLLLQLHSASHMLAATDRQKDFYLGIMSDQKMINPKSYKTSSDFISLAPFGISEGKPEGDNLISKKFPGIMDNDFILYWGGGVWDWFDPISVVKAVENLSAKRKNLKLVFAGVKHPNPKIKAMARAEELIDYCKGHDLLDKTVFINFGWLPYEERVGFLKRANVGISAHLDSLETRFSFRTRILDYLWAEIPIIETIGDSFAELIKSKKLGLTVGYQNVAELEEAIEKMMDDQAFYNECRRNVTLLKESFRWQNIAGDIGQVITDTHIVAPKISCWQFARLTYNFYLAGIKKKLFK